MLQSCLPNHLCRQYHMVGKHKTVASTFPNAHILHAKETNCYLLVSLMWLDARTPHPR
jgi:hypothetical protein